ncbi:MAG: hypothetical protein FWD16_06155 [Clostridia bacterium]|nr:hypothetical protein [Clostridia bacterium]
MNKHWLSLLGLCLLALICIRPAGCLQGARASAELFATTLLPSLLPAAFAAQLITAGGGGRYPGARAMVTGLICGTPAGSLAAVEAGKRRPDAPLWPLVCICGVSPAFLLGALPAMAGARPAGAVFLLSCVGANAFLSIMALLYYKYHAKSPRLNNKTSPAVHNPLSITGYLMAAAHGMAVVAVTSIVIGAVMGGVESIINIPPYVAALLDMPEGCARIAASALPLWQKLIAMSAAATFGGLPILLQQWVILRHMGVTMPKLLAVKALSAVIAKGIAALMIRGLDMPVSTFAKDAPHSVWGLTAAIIMIILLLPASAQRLPAPRWSR